MLKSILVFLFIHFVLRFLTICLKYYFMKDYIFWGGNKPIFFATALTDF